MSRINILQNVLIAPGLEEITISDLLRSSISVEEYEAAMRDVSLPQSLDIDLFEVPAGPAVDVICEVPAASTFGVNGEAAVTVPAPVEDNSSEPAGPGPAPASLGVSERILENIFTPREASSPTETRDLDVTPSAAAAPEYSLDEFDGDVLEQIERATEFANAEAERDRLAMDISRRNQAIIRLQKENIRQQQLLMSMNKKIALFRRGQKRLNKK